MRTVALAGASGLVGGRLLAHLLEHKDVERVVAVVRRPLAVKSDKLEERSLGDEMPKDVEDAYCALGTTMKKAGSKEAFLAVDKDAVLAFARACRANGARRFLLVSSLGADPRSMTFYLRVKGEVEEELRGMGFDAVHVLRPSFLDGERTEARPAERIALRFARALKPVLGKYGPIEADVVARAMVKLAFSDRFGFCVHESNAIGKI